MGIRASGSVQRQELRHLYQPLGGILNTLDISAHKTTHWTCLPPQVTFDALKPFGEPMEQSPTPLPYLRETDDGKTVTSYVPCRSAIPVAPSAA